MMGIVPFIATAGLPDCGNEWNQNGVQQSASVR
jgi:hypothetical protein